MKKILSVLVLVSLLIGLIVPMISLAQNGAPDSCTIRRDTGISGCPAVGGACTYDTLYNGTRGAVCCLFSTLNYASDWLFMILMAMVVFFIVWGALKMITAGGSEEGVEKGRRYIVYGIYGVIIALLARAIPIIIKSIMGV